MNPSFAGHAMRFVAAASLACTLATVGCTTNRTPGSGRPVRYGPSVGPTMPSSMSTPGSEQGNPINPPMISSYSPAPGSVILRHVNTDALAIAAAEQGFRGRYLGPADPGGTVGYASANLVTGQYISPSDTANPEITSKLIIGRAANGTVTVTNISAVGNRLVMPRP